VLFIKLRSLKIFNFVDPFTIWMAQIHYADKHPWGYEQICSIK